MINRYWREISIVVVVALSLLAIVVAGPIAQSPGYNDFADTRAIAGIPNFANVVSNIFFLVFGFIGLLFSVGPRRSGASRSWTVFFIGVTLVSVGSGYYHADPQDARLLWDRLPMTVAFMGLFSALLDEHIKPGLERSLLLPALLVGIASVIWWAVTGDLRFYVWVQLAPFLTILCAVAMFPPKFTHRAYLLYGLGTYGLAKIAELYDEQLYALTSQSISGHSVKHVLASVSAVFIFVMLKQRSAIRIKDR